ncbi:hypothetical protein FDECE_12595 [Fusarium decemcellulare]|nr:hypothetical protein FDECE_12595 [Fusarium decemcellulare]
MSSQPKETSHATSLFEDGLKNRRKVVGGAYVDLALRNGSTEFAYPNQQLVTDLTTRSGLGIMELMLTDVVLDIGMLVALKSWPELAIHIRGAINNGLTEVEIREALLQTSIYCGVPAGIEATKTATRVIDEMVANGEHQREMATVSPLLE